MYDNFEKIIEGAISNGPRQVAVAGINDTTLSVLLEAKKTGIADSIIVDTPVNIRAAADAAGVENVAFETVEADNENDACIKAAALVRDGRAEVLMKGHVQTPSFFRAALDSEAGLRTEKRVSHCFLFTTDRSPRIRIMTDGALIVSPDVESKALMIENAVALMKKLGWKKPKVAILAGTEEVRVDMPASIDAVELVRRHAAGAFPGAVVEGPIALDVAVDFESARKKGLENSPVAGNADILVTPDMLVCNIAAKCIYHFTHARYAGIVVGAAAPIVSLSRADTARAKLDTLALGVLATSL